MPIYEYQCQACQHEMEALRKISDPPLEACPACGASELRKKVSAAAFRLKGAGWYETDFKTGDKKNLAGDKSGDAAGKGDASTEGKQPASKSSAKSESSNSDNTASKSAASS